MLATVSYMRQVVHGELMRELREAAGLTFKQLEGLTGISASTLWRIEGGRSQPRTQQLAAIAAALGLRPDQLLVEGDEADVETRARAAREPTVLRGKGNVGNLYGVEVRRMPRVPLLGIVPAPVDRYALQGGTIPVPGEALEGVREPGVVRVAGDDPALGLYDGELAIVDQAVTDWRSGETYLVEMGGRVVFCKVTDALAAPAATRCLGLLCWIIKPPRRPS